MTLRRDTRIRSGLIGVLIMTIVLGAVAGYAAETSSDVSLTAGQTALDVLSPTTTSGSTVFPVDECTSIYVEIHSALADLTTSILTPGGTTIDADSAAGAGGSYFAFESPDVAGGSLLSPGLKTGWHYVYLIPIDGTGSYTVSYTASSVTEDEPVIIDLETNSPLGSALLTADTMIALGQGTALVAPVFESTVAVPGATVDLNILTPGGAVITDVLLDNGLDADDASTDGLYSYLFTPTEVGTYRAVIEVTGTNSAGTMFKRHAGTLIRAIESSATLTGVVTEQAVDLNANGLFDQIEVTVETDISSTGLHALHVALVTPGGQVITGYGEATLAAGTQSITANVPAAAIRANGEDGPYTIDRVALSFVDDDANMLPVAELADGSQQTLAYLLTAFERPLIELTGVTSNAVSDDDGDDDFDSLIVTAGIEVVVDGDYDYTVVLTDTCGNEIEFLSGSQTLASTANPDSLVFQFDGSLIGTHGLDGPFKVHDLSLNGPGGWVLAHEIAETPAYAASEFDSYIPHPDCNANGKPDACDIRAGTSLDCNENRIPDECEPDCNSNGVADGCDISARTSTDCDLNGIPDECDLMGGTAGDCNANGLSDSCDLWGTAAVPAADACDEAKSICPGFIYEDSTVPATSDGHAGCGLTDGSPDVWYRYAPAVDGELTVSLCGSLLDTVLSVHTACPGAEANELACNNNACNSASYVILTVSAGVDYFIRVTGDEGDAGAFMLELTGPECTTRSTDCNGNEVPDECDLANGLSDDCNGNDLPDECEADCNTNGIADSCELAAGTSADCNTNAIPDACEPDCDENGVPDDCEIAASTGVDCNANGVPDGCEADCNANGVPDDCDLAAMTSIDCDANGIPDDCDEDCDGNGVPDTCDLASGTHEDCNGNSIPDACDIDDEPGNDCNTNGVPDECELDGSLPMMFPFPVEPPRPVADYLPTVLHTVFVPEGGTILDVNVELHLAHTWIGDLMIAVEHHGVVVHLYDMECGDVDDLLGTVFDDEAAGPVPCVPANTGPAVPTTPLSAFDGMSLAGPWRLAVADLAPGDEGALLGWALHVEVEEIGANDCNGNGTLDECDISSAASSDLNGNGLPDECEPGFGTGDCDDDDDIDLADFGHFQKCHAGSGEVPSPGCECADLDADGDVDDDDYAVMHAIITGPVGSS